MNRRLKFWLAGFTAGGVLWCFWYLLNSGRILLDPNNLLILEPATYILWPSSLMLMSLSGTNTTSTWGITLASLAMNGFIYMGVGSILSRVFHTDPPPANTTTKKQ